MAKIWLSSPSFGPAITIIYVMPSKGISTKSAFDALRYWRVSTVFADRNFVISTFHSSQRDKKGKARLSKIYAAGALSLLNSQT